MKSHQDRIIELAKRSRGVSRADTKDCVQKASRPVILERFDAMVAESTLNPAKIGKAVRFFLTAEAASAYLANPALHLMRIKRTPVAQPPGLLHGTPHVGPAKITVCPSPKFDHRYQVDPKERVLGGFATAGIGRYLDGNA